MHKFKIGVDLDGVMCDMLTPLLVLYNQTYGTSLTVEDIVTWELPEGSFELFSQTKDFFRGLDPIQGAIEGVNELAISHDLFFVSCAANVPQVAHDKMTWWIEHNLTHIPLIITGKKYLLDLDILIDDAPHHVEEFVTSSDSKLSILVNAHYNQEVQTGEEHRIFRALDWGEIINLCQTKGSLLKNMKDV